MPEIRQIRPSECRDWFLTKHYLKRMPPVSYAYGLYEEGELFGVVSFGKPASNPLCKGVCGDSFSEKVYELNRLVVQEPHPFKNAPSYLVGGALRFLKKKNLIIVSYADTMMSHCGYIYQATNWIYTGKTKARTDMFSEGHPRHYNETTKRQNRSAKHRYVYFAGDKRFKRSAKASLLYKVEDYPKDVNKRYDAGGSLGTQLLLAV